jgi:hypothetical protein
MRGHSGLVGGFVNEGENFQRGSAAGNYDPRFCLSNAMPGFGRVALASRPKLTQVSREPAQLAGT